MLHRSIKKIYFCLKNTFVSQPQLQDPGLKCLKTLYGYTLNDFKTKHGYFNTIVGLSKI